MPETMQQLLRERADDDQPAIIHEDQVTSWRDYVAVGGTEAAALLELVDRERPVHVGAVLANSPQMLRSMAAAALGGYVLCGVNTTRRGAGLSADILRAECQVLLTDDEHLSLVETITDDLAAADVRVINTDSAEWSDLLGAAGALTPLREVEAMDTFMMIFTSGTSGDPKAVQVTHLFPLFSGLHLAEKVGLTAADVCYISMPLFHSNAVAAGWAPAACSGAAMVPARFSASGFLDDIRRYCATYMNYVGKPLAYVLATPEKADDADNPLRIAFGNEASDRDIEEFSRRFDCRVVDGFGSTELAIIITRDEGTPPGSIGRGGEEVAVFNSETLEECPRAEFDENGALLNADEAIGELVNTTGAGYFSGYYNDPAANQERMRHGMYWSGDLAYRDAEGWVYLAGRTADWMRVDGENLAAGPIERVLQRLPAVSRVAVYAVPDPNVGDQVMAAIVLRDESELTPGELERFLAAQADLSPKAWPRYVRLTATLPATATNKVIKRELVAQGVDGGEGVLWVRQERGTSYEERG
ncbi:fatty-acid--CoA ligase FadD1 [Nocardioides bizhenqiangii]|uniref:Fatty-acid--CoA ligase FadD1 n=1 Tax=Nocardioides bizhenqiangii TaxID=3095076 RepID=A0ABZ0ZWU5_9ACTN|nr:fatty-acid--CoA ligase FadD1 [Nocardioides sp. HM61]WQQ28713.1 fatty-acid--CoA ligase FadD1 [Nocardioides sp. HM61]